MRRCLLLLTLVAAPALADVSPPAQPSPLSSWTRRCAAHFEHARKEAARRGFTPLDDETAVEVTASSVKLGFAEGSSCMHHHYGTVEVRQRAHDRTHGWRRHPQTGEYQSSRGHARLIGTVSYLDQNESDGGGCPSGVDAFIELFEQAIDRCLADES